MALIYMIWREQNPLGVSALTVGGYGWRLNIKVSPSRRYLGGSPIKT
jgi:hypothetical protein